jgi:hypothetical protein
VQSGVNKIDLRNRVFDWDSSSGDYLSVQYFLARKLGERNDLKPVRWNYHKGGIQDQSNRLGSIIIAIIIDRGFNNRSNNRSSVIRSIILKSFNPEQFIIKNESYRRPIYTTRNHMTLPILAALATLTYNLLLLHDFSLMAVAMCYMSSLDTAGARNIPTDYRSIDRINTSSYSKFARRCT